MAKPQYLDAPKVSLHSLALDGTTDFVTFEDQTYEINAGGNNLTISFWAKRTDNNDEAVVLGHSGSGSFKRLYFDSAGDKLYIESDLNGQEAYAAVTADTNWHHYAITITGKTGDAATVAAFEDGSAVVVSNTNFGASESRNITFNRIGDDNAAGNQAFKGLLYQVAIHNKLLAGAEILNLYNSGVPIPVDGNAGNYISSLNLLNLWKFNEGEGTSIADFGFLNLTGTLSGNATFSLTTPIS